MSGAFRIPRAGRLSQAKTARFSFDGQSYTGIEGDTLASALLANGVHLVGRSFKYHRPRGFLSAGAEEPNALVQIVRDDARKTPNVRATVQELYDGLAANSQNRWPSLSFDVGAVNDLASPMFSAGFYYKTFMWPKSAWKHVYEPNIRAAAGLGVAPDQPDPDHYSARYAHCEVLVLGGGAADQRLVELLPEGGRPHEGLVVEPCGDHFAGDAVHSHQVEGERGPAVLRAGGKPVIDLLHGGADVGRLAGAIALDGDQRVRLLRARRQDAARTMVLERAADEMDVVGDQRGGERVAFEGGVFLAVEGKADGLAGEAALAGDAVEGGHWAGLGEVGALRRPHPGKVGALRRPPLSCRTSPPRGFLCERAVAEVAWR